MTKKVKTVKSIDRSSSASKRGRGFVYKSLSSTMLKTWLECPRKFHLHYVEGIPSKPNTSFSLGNAVHYALELANHRLVETDNKRLTYEDIDEFVQEARDHLSGVDNKDHFVDDMELFESAEEMVRTELSGLDYTEKVIDVEKNFRIITPEGVTIGGFIDKVVEVDENTVKIVDYKTSRMPLSYEEAKKDVQLSMYELAAAILYPQYSNRKVELRYLRLNSSVKTDRSPIAQLNFRKQLLSVDKAINQYMDNLSPNSKAPKGSTHDLCSWCSYKKECNEYQSQLIQLGSAYELPTQLDDETFIDQYKKVQSSLKELKQLQDDLKLWAMRRIEADPDTPISDGTVVVNPLSTTRKTYEPAIISKLLGYNDYVEVSSINNSKMKRLLGTVKDDMLRTRLEQSVTVKFNNPQIRFKKV
jgi:hypothetical protein